METLDKLHLSITVHMYVLVAIEDVLTYVHFNPQCFKLKEKKKDISKPQLRLYQQLQLILVLLISSMRLLNEQPCDYLPLRDYRVEDFWYLCCNSI